MACTCRHAWETRPGRTDGQTQEDRARPEIRRLQSPGSHEPDAAGCRYAGVVQEEDAAGHLSLRFVALAGPRLGWAEPRSGAGGSDPRRPRRPARRNPRRTERPGPRPVRARPPRPLRTRRHGVDRPAQGHVPPLPELGGQGRAALVRRADPPPVRPRETLDQGHRGDLGWAPA